MQAMTCSSSSCWQNREAATVQAEAAGCRVAADAAAQCRPSLLGHPKATQQQSLAHRQLHHAAERAARMLYVAPGAAAASGRTQQQIWGVPLPRALSHTWEAGCRLPLAKAAQQVRQQGTNSSSSSSHCFRKIRRSSRWCLREQQTHAALMGMQTMLGSCPACMGSPCLQPSVWQTSCGR